MASIHHPFAAPSALESLSACPYFRGRQGPPGEAAERGNRIHNAVFSIHAGKEPEGLPHDEMEEAEWAASEVAQIQAEWHGSAVIEPILRVTHPDTGMELTWGSPDFAILNSDECPVIIDIKTGQKSGRYMRQLAAYALAAMQITGHDYAFCTILWTQARDRDTFGITMNEAKRLVVPVVEMAEGALESGMADYTSGPQCFYCGEKESCNEFKGAMAGILSSRGGVAERLKEVPAIERKRVVEEVLNAYTWAELAKNSVKEIIKSGEIEIPGVYVSGNGAIKVRRD